MFTASTFFLLLVRLIITGIVMFFSFKYGVLAGILSLGIWWVLESVFGIERMARFLQAQRPAEGVDREVYDKTRQLVGRSAGAIFAEQFFAWVTILAIYCVIGWKLDISPLHVILAYLGADLFAWPYSISRLRQAVRNKEPQKEKEDVYEILDDIINGE